MRAPAPPDARKNTLEQRGGVSRVCVCVCVRLCLCTRASARPPDARKHTLEQTGGVLSVPLMTKQQMDE